MTRNTKGQFRSVKHWFVEMYHADTGEMTLHARTREHARTLARTFTALNPDSFTRITN